MAVTKAKWRKDWAVQLGSRTFAFIIPMVQTPTNPRTDSGCARPPQYRLNWGPAPLPANIRTRMCRTPYNSYRVLHHAPGVAVTAEETPYASVVTDAETGEVYGFSSPATVSLSDFIQRVVPAGQPRTRPLLDVSRIIVSERIEGTAVNLWFDRRADRWEISTQEAVGGDYTYYRNYQMEDADPNHARDKDHPVGGFAGPTTYLRMFLDALVGPATPLPPPALLSDFLTSLVSSWKWSKRYCYCFVLQHPHNPLVFHITVPRIALVAVYQKRRFQRSATSVTMQAIDPMVFRTWEEFHSAPGLFFPAMLTDPLSYQTFLRPYRSIHSRLEDVGAGVMLTDRVTGLQTKVESALYEELRRLRRNHPVLFFQYLCLHYTKKTTEFLQHFPQYQSVFDLFRQDYVGFIINLHASYVTKYVEGSDEPIAPRYLPHIQYLHHYVALPRCPFGGQGATLHMVQEYLDKLTPEEVFRCLDVDALLPKTVQV